MKNKNCGNHTQAMTATLFRHLNEQVPWKRQGLQVTYVICWRRVYVYVYDLSDHERIRQRADDGNALNFNTMLDTQGWCKGPRRKNMPIYGARTLIS